MKELELTIRCRADGTEQRQVILNEISDSRGDVGVGPSTIQSMIYIHEKTIVGTHRSREVMRREDPAVS
jgi:hypothetical protein